MKQKKPIFFLAVTLLMFCNSTVFGQSETLGKLKQLSHTVLYGSTDNAKTAASSKLAHKLDSILHLPNPALFPFDSLPSISTLLSSNKTLIIVTWNIPLSTGNFKYDGFVVVDMGTKTRVYRLKDTSDSLRTPEKISLTAQNWYGALYYKLIETGKRDQKTYTLLGWDGNNKLFKRKIIEILEFNKDGEPIFGKPIFGQRDKKRIFFEYAPDATFKLRFEKQGYRTKRWYKRSYSIVKKEMIVFDRLESLQPGLGLQPQFLVPTGNIIDAYLFKNGRWNLIKDIDARNPEEEPTKQPTKQPTFNLVPKN